VRSRLPAFRRNTSLLAHARDDPDAFADFYDAYAERVLVFLVRRILDVDTAFDLLSETFAKALEHRHQFRGRSAEEEQGWLFAIARSELSHYWRDGQVERSALARIAVAVPVLDDPSIDRIEQLAGISELAPMLRDAMDALPEDQRRAVELRVIDECEYAEVAQALGVSEQAARARVSRGLRALAHLVQDPATMMQDAA
jgi:RNA polymerase sigma factor (sigma-70 family)